MTNLITLAATKSLSIDSIAARRIPNIVPATGKPSSRIIATKGFDSKAVKIARELTLEAEANLTAFCSITGLTVSTDMPANLGFGIATIHPIAFNCRTLLEQPAYIAKLSNAQLAGFILGLLAEQDKIIIKKGSNAYFTRAKLEVIASRNRLLDIIEWIANSLMVTKLYYPKLVTSHTELTLDSLQEWMEWTYSIEVYSFAGSKLSPTDNPSEVERATKVKAPKRLKVSDTALRRLNRGFDSTLKDLATLLEAHTTDSIPTKVAINIEHILKGKASTESSKIDNLLATMLLDSVLASTVQSLIDYRNAVARAVEANSTVLDDLVDAALTDLATEEQPVGEPILEATSLEEAPSLAPTLEEAPKLTFRERLELARAAAKGATV